MNDLPYWLAAVQLENVSLRKLLRGLNFFKSFEKLFKASKDELQGAGFSLPETMLLTEVDWQVVESELSWEKEEECHLITYLDPAYPDLLKEITNPPLVLYVQGNKEALKQFQIAIVGARNATVTGKENADYFAYTLAKAGVTITSGLALGIDGASHAGALKAEGTTIAVAGTGLDLIYPKQHQTLARTIIEKKGAIISEFPLKTTPKPANFPKRNRIISGLSAGVLVVEAAFKSGSLITAKYALEQGREVFAIPGSIHQPLSRGCHDLIRQGAKLVECVQDILEELQGFAEILDTGNSAIKRHGSHRPISATPPDPQLRRLWEQIGHEITPMDVILSRIRLTASEVSSMLLTLELNGYIQSVPGGYIRCQVQAVNVSQ